MFGCWSGAQISHSLRNEKRFVPSGGASIGWMYVCAHSTVKNFFFEKVWGSKNKKRIKKRETLINNFYFTSRLWDTNTHTHSATQGCDIHPTAIILRTKVANDTEKLAAIFNKRYKNKNKRNTKNE